MTHNEAGNLPRLFASLPARMPTLVIDAQSTDATVELARAHGAAVEVRPWAGFVATRCYALGRVQTPWSLMLDADEALDDKLPAALLAAAPSEATAGFRLPRTTFFCGRPIGGCGWGDDRPLRLFRTARAQLVARPASGGAAELHEAWEVDGAVGELAGTILHHSYPTMRSYRVKFARYTAIEAAGLHFNLASLTRTAARAAVRAPWLYIGRGGWRDGWRGAFIALASAAYPVVAVLKSRRR